MEIVICMATYNGKKYLKEQLDSIINQSYQHWKLFIHDDNSNDGTIEIVKNYSFKYPNKIIFLDDNIKCGGAKENFNYLLENINDNYDYVMFCDQDDIWLNDKIKDFHLKIKESEEKFSKNMPLVIFSDLKVVDENLNIISNSMIKYQKLNPKIANYFNLLKCQNVVTGCAMIVNKKAIDMSTPIPKEALMHDWWIALITAKYGKNIYLNKQTILYRQHDNNTVGSKNITFNRIFKIIFSKKIFNDFQKINNMLNKIDNEKLNFFCFLVCKLKATFIRFKNEK